MAVTGIRISSYCQRKISNIYPLKKPNDFLTREGGEQAKNLQRLQMLAEEEEAPQKCQTELEVTHHVVAAWG